jgi:hypothetical protein
MPDRASHDRKFTRNSHMLVRGPEFELRSLRYWLSRLRSERGIV